MADVVAPEQIYYRLVRSNSPYHNLSIRFSDMDREILKQLKKLKRNDVEYERRRSAYIDGFHEKMKENKDEGRSLEASLRIVKSEQETYL